MNKIFLSTIMGLTTLAVVNAAETQTQPETGKPAPDFSLTTGDGSHVSLKDYRGKWIVLYFYPKDFTSGCTMEAHNFQRDLTKYNEADAVILTVSKMDAEKRANPGYRAFFANGFTSFIWPRSAPTINTSDTPPICSQIYFQLQSFSRLMSRIFSVSSVRVMGHLR